MIPDDDATVNANNEAFVLKRIDMFFFRVFLNVILEDDATVNVKRDASAVK